MDSKQKLDQDTNNIANLYSNLEDKIFSEIIKVLQRGHYEDVTQDNVVNWQAWYFKRMWRISINELNHFKEYLIDKNFMKKIYYYWNMNCTNEIDEE